MNTEQTNPKPHDKSGVVSLIFAVIFLIATIVVAWLSQINPRGDVFWGGVRLLFYIGSGFIFTFLITTHIAIKKAPLKSTLIVLSFLLSASFFIICILITNYLGSSYNSFLIKSKQNKIEKNINSIITLKQSPLNDQEIFNTNGFFIKSEKEKQSQYYYLNDSKELVEITSLQDKNVTTYGQFPILSPLKDKIAVVIDDQLYIYNKSLNKLWTISIDKTNYDYLYFRKFFFNKDEQLIFSVTHFTLDGFSMIGRMDFSNGTIRFSSTNERENLIYPDNQKIDACENIDAIDITNRAYQPSSSNNCLYVTSSYNEQIRDYIYTLKLYNNLNNSTKTLLENDYSNIDILPIIHIAI